MEGTIAMAKVHIFLGGKYRWWNETAPVSSTGVGVEILKELSVGRF